MSTVTHAAHVLVLGGTQFLGAHIARALVTAGCDVTCAARGESGEPVLGVRFVRIDRDDDSGLAPLCSQQWDAVVDVASEPTFVQRAVRDLWACAQRYVYISTVSVYRDFSTVGQDESADVYDVDHVPEHPGEAYGVEKRACELLVQQAFPGNHWILRCGLLGGPGDKSWRTIYWPWRFRGVGNDHDARVLVPDMGEALVQLIDARDVAEWVAQGVNPAVPQTKSLTGVFNVVGHPVTFQELLSECASLASATPDVVAMEWAWLADQGVAPWAGPGSLPLVLPDPAYAGFMDIDGRKARDAGLVIRPLRQTLADGVAGLGESNPDLPSGLSADRERELLLQWEQHRQSAVR